MIERLPEELTSRADHAADVSDLATIWSKVNEIIDLVNGQPEPQTLWICASCERSIITIGGHRPDDWGHNADGVLLCSECKPRPQVVGWVCCRCGAKVAELPDNWLVRDSGVFCNRCRS